MEKACQAKEGSIPENVMPQFQIPESSGPLPISIGNPMSDRFSAFSVGSLLFFFRAASILNPLKTSWIETVDAALP